MRGRTSAAVLERGGRMANNRKHDWNLGVSHSLLDNIGRGCDALGTHGDIGDKIVGIDQASPVYVIEFPKGDPVRGQMSGPCDVEGRTLINFAPGDATNTRMRGTPIMLKRTTLRMLETKTDGSDAQHQRSEAPQSTACFVSNNASMVPNF